VLARQYPPRAVLTLGGRLESPADPADLARADLSQTRVIQSHLAFGLHRQLDGPATYVTMLREPVDRMISLYYFTLQDDYRAIHREARESLSSLEAFVAGGALLETDNGQVRRLSGQPAEFGRCTSEMLELARLNIRDHFALVGLSERFDESLLLMRERFGWGPVFYLREKTTARRPARRDLSPATVEAILEHNRLDLELYRFAEQLHAELVARAGPDFQAEVQAFGALNAELTRRAGPRVSGVGCQVSGAEPRAPGTRHPTPASEATILDAHAHLLAREADLLREAVRLERRLRHRDKELTEARREAAGLGRRVQQLDAELAALRAKLEDARERLRRIEASRLGRVAAAYRRLRARAATILGHSPSPPHS
jgi:hypothetical protein